MRSDSSRKSKAPPLEEAKLRALALRYVERYATSEAKLRRYLERKIFERGWQGEQPADTAKLAREFAELGYVDDVALAEAKSRASVRKGHGARRLAQTLFQDGIDEQDSFAAMQDAQENAWIAALNFARKRRIGPFADYPADSDMRRKQLAAFLRAGHSFDLAAKFVNAEPGEEPTEE